MLISTMRERKSFFDPFDSEFKRQLPVQNNYRDAFEAASKKFIDVLGQSPYSSLESYQSQRSKRRRKK